MRPSGATAGMAMVVLALGAACGTSDPEDPGSTSGADDLTRLALTAQSPEGGAPDPDVVERTGELLTQRFEDAGFREPNVSTDGDRIVVTVAGEIGAERAETLVAPSELQFRKVVARSSAPAGAGATQTPTVTERDPADVAGLPARTQFSASVTCAQLDDRPAGVRPDPDGLVVACDAAGAKYLLDTARVTGPQVADATAAQAEAQADRWTVTIEFTEEGQSQWTALTQEAVDNPGAAFDLPQLGGDDRYTGPTPIQCDPPTAVGPSGNCLVAITLDYTVISAPEIFVVITGDAQVTGDFTADEARTLAAQLRTGALPLNLEVDALEPVPRR